MIEISSDVVATLRLCRANANATEQPHFQIIPGHSPFVFGYDPESEDFLVAMGQSLGQSFRWREITASMREMRGEFPSLTISPHDTFRIFAFGENTIHRLSDFLGELVLQIDPEDVDSSFDAILQNFEETFQTLSDPLSRSEQTGLFGELVTLYNLVLQRGVQTTNAWVGPTGTLHDFEDEDWHIEVKSSLLPDPVARIHPQDQLEPNGLPFNLVVISLSLGGDNTSSLPDLIQLIRDELSGSDGPQLHFETTLACSGYSDDHADLYDREYSWEISRLPIDEDAPVLYPAMINNRARYSHLRWWLRHSDHDFIEVDDEFWLNPTID